MSETYDEWRVTGALVDPGESYEFTWSPKRNPHLGDSEVAARNFVNLFAGRFGTWTDGPHLTRRTVTVTDWEPA